MAVEVRDIFLVLWRKRTERAATHSGLMALLTGAKFAC